MIANVVEVIPPWIIGAAIDEIAMNSMTADSLRNYLLAIILIIVVGYAMNFTWQYQLFGGAITLERIFRKN